MEEGVFIVIVIVTDNNYNIKLLFSKTNFIKI